MKTILGFRIGVRLNTSTYLMDVLLSSSHLHMLYFARFGIICTIWKSEKHAWRHVTLSKVASFSFQKWHSSMIVFRFFEFYKWYQIVQSSTYVPKNWNNYREAWMIKSLVGVMQTWSPNLISKPNSLILLKKSTKNKQPRLWNILNKA